MLEMPGMGQNWPEREAAWIKGSRSGQVRLQMAVGTQVMPFQAPDAPEVQIQTAAGFGGPPAVLVWLWNDISLPCLHSSLSMGQYTTLY